MVAINMIVRHVRQQLLEVCVILCAICFVFSNVVFLFRSKTSTYFYLQRGFNIR